MSHALGESLALPKSVERLIRDVVQSATEKELEAVFVESTTIGAIKRLGEMRLLVLGDEGIVGMTDLGRRVLIGLLYYAHKSAGPESMHRDNFGRAVLSATRILCFEQLPDELRVEFERIANGGDPS